MVEKRKEQKSVHITYNQYAGLMRKLVAKVNSYIHNKEKIAGFYGLKRGGWPIAVHLSHHCGLPVLDKPQKNCIIVDDVCDSGNTLKKYYKKYPIVVLFYKENEFVKPTIFLKKIPQKDWIVFSWEVM